MLNLMTTNQSEIMDKCKPEEWFNIINGAKTLKAATDAFEQGRMIMDKYFLHTQRKNRWNWLIQFAVYDELQFAFFDAMFALQGINKQHFASAVYDWLNCSHKKKNTLFFVGPPNSGKTLIARLLTDKFMCGNMNLKGITSDFYYEVLINKSVGVMEELWVLPQVVDDFKNILGGTVMDINKKHMPMQRLGRLPIIVTCNHDRLGRGFLHGVDETALHNRMFKFIFTTDISNLINDVHVTVEGFAHWLLINYEKV